MKVWWTYWFSFIISIVVPDERKMWGLRVFNFVDLENIEISIDLESKIQDWIQTKPVGLYFEWVEWRILKIWKYEIEFI